jgi:NADH-quinone oxidoreductase subunit C
MTLVEQIKTKFPVAVVEIVDQQGDWLIYVKRELAQKLMPALKSEPEFQLDMLMDLFAIDFLHWEEKALRFEVVYQLYSTVRHHRLFVKIAVDEKDPWVDSVVSVWPAANWYEREVWDMFGVVFKGHPNLKRILMYEEFKGHALRKDYPYNRRQPLVGPLN